MAKKNKQHPERKRAHSDNALISVCMIVKDEEANLDRCLRSVRQVADEIIVVDTGSRDATIDIAHRYGAKVSHFQWCDDFAAARNAALAQATGRWVLQMDADEELTPESACKVRQVVSDAPSKCWGFLIRCRSYKMEDGQKIHTFIHRLLLFLKHPDLRYRNRVHENLEYIGKGPKPDFWINDDVVIEHYGYMPEPMLAKKKDERNLRLLQLAVAENPDEAFHQFNLGTHYYSMKKFAKAVEPLQRAVALCKENSANYLPNAYAMLVLALCHAGRGEEVPAAVAEAERRIPLLTAEFHCNAGTALRMIGRLDEALVQYKRATEVDDVHAGSEFDPSSHTWLPRFGIGTIYELQGQIERARDCYEEALSQAPQHTALNGRLAVVAAKLGQPSRALKYVERALESGPTSEEVSWELLQVCEELAGPPELGEVDSTVLKRIGGELVRRVVPTPEIGTKLSSACIRFGQFERGIAAASVALEQAEDLLARVNRGLCYFNVERYQEAADDFAKALEMEPNNSSALANLGIAQKLGHIMNAPSNLRQEVKSAPGNAPNDIAENAAVQCEKDIPLASIIVPVFDNVEHTKRCIQAIAENTPEDLYEVIIVDNASTDGTKDFLKLLSGDVRIITNNTNLGFAKACNQAAQIAQSKYLVFLNNATEPQNGWLESLIDLAEKDPSVGAVGAKLVRPDGTLQEAGAVVFRDGTLQQCGKGMDSADPRFDVVREIDYCSAASLLVRREMWNEINGFDVLYVSDSYQAADLCFSIRKAGHLVMYQPAAEVIHHAISG